MFTHDKNMLSYDQIGCFFKQANTSPRRWARILNSIKKAWALGDLEQIPVMGAETGVYPLVN